MRVISTEQKKATNFVGNVLHCCFHSFSPEEYVEAYGTHFFRYSQFGSVSRAVHLFELDLFSWNEIGYDSNSINYNSIKIAIIVVMRINLMNDSRTQFKLIVCLRIWLWVNLFAIGYALFVCVWQRIYYDKLRQFVILKHVKTYGCCEGKRLIAKN